MQTNADRLKEGFQIRKLGGTGILTESDLPRLNSQKRNVWNLMCDGRWHHSSAIVSHAGGTEGLRRMRELREMPGVEIERTREPNMSWSYRIKPRYI